MAKEAEEAAEKAAAVARGELPADADDGMAPDPDDGGSQSGEEPDVILSGIDDE